MNELLKKIEEYGLDVQFRIVGRKPYRVDGFRGVDLECVMKGQALRVRISSEHYKETMDDYDVFKEALATIVRMIDMWKGHEDE